MIRHFRDKAGFFAATSEREYERVHHQRDQAPVGDVRAAARILVDHYEELDDAVLHLLAEEHRLPELREAGTYHAVWCERVFAPAQRGLKGEAYSRRLEEFVAVADVSM